MTMEDHAGGGVSDGGIWMGSKVVEQVGALFVGVLVALVALVALDCLAEIEPILTRAVGLAAPLV